MHVDGSGLSDGERGPEMRGDGGGAGAAAPRRVAARGDRPVGRMGDVGSVAVRAGAGPRCR